MYLPERKIALIQQIAQTQDEALIAELEAVLAEAQQGGWQQPVEFPNRSSQTIEPFEEDPEPKEEETDHLRRRNSETGTQDGDRRRFFFGRTR